MSAAVHNIAVVHPTISEVVEFAWEYMDQGDFLAAADCFSDAAKLARAKFLQLGKQLECPSSPDGRHQLDTSMESGSNNCFHCEADIRTDPRRSA